MLLDGAAARLTDVALRRVGVAAALMQVVGHFQLLTPRQRGARIELQHLVVTPNGQSEVAGLQRVEGGLARAFGRRQFDFAQRLGRQRRHGGDRRG